MGFFGSGKDKPDEASLALVLAYLEEALRQKSAFILTDSRKLAIAATLIDIQEKEGTCILQAQGPFMANKGAKVDILLFQDNLRLGLSALLQEQRGNSLTFALPSHLTLQERRQSPRARLLPKEGATLTGLSGLFEGIGVHGLIENLSEGGCLVRLEKAMSVGNDKRLPLGKALLPVGHAFPILKLNKVPRCPSVMELSGKVVFLNDEAGLCLGIAFGKSEVAGVIKSFVASRATALPNSVPPKARRKPPEESPVKESQLPKEAPSLVLDASLKESPPAASEASIPLPSSDKATQPAPASGSANGRNVALLKLKKKSRTLMVLASEEQGLLLAKQLLQEGYKQVILTENWEEVITHLHEHDTDGLIIDIPTPSRDTFAMITRLREAGMTLPPVVMAIEEASASIVGAACQLGLGAILTKPYELGERFSMQVEQSLSLL